MLRHIIIFSYIFPISLHERNFNLVTLFSLPSSSSPALFQSIKNKIFELILSRNFHRACKVSCLWLPCMVFIPWYFTGRFLWTLTSRTDDLKCWEIFHFSSDAQLCPALCNSTDCSTPGFPVHHQFPEFTQTHVIESCHPTISSSVVPFSSHLQSFSASGSFPVSHFFTSGGQSIGVSPSASVLLMTIQDWLPLGWTGWISLQSKGLSRVFSNTTVQKHQFFWSQLSSQSNSHIHTWPLEKP